MEAEELYRVFKQQPFTPVRVYVSDSSSYEVTHPDQVIISRQTSYIGMHGNRRGPFQSVAIVANIHITRVEPVKPRRPRARRPGARSPDTGG